MLVTNALQWVVGEGDVALRLVAAEDEASAKIVHLGREAQDDSIVTLSGPLGFEGIVLRLVVEFIEPTLANDVR